MKNKLLIILILVLSAQVSTAQKVLTLDEVIRLAQDWLSVLQLATVCLGPRFG